MDNHLRAVSRVYGPETWNVYDLLDRSLDPRGPDVMLALATERLTPPLSFSMWAAAMPPTSSDWFGPLARAESESTP